MKLAQIVLDARTDFYAVAGVCVRLTSAKSIARAAGCGSGDGLQPSQSSGSASPWRAPAVGEEARAVSYRAIAAALALEEVSIGERLVAFSLASYANRAQQAWPAARTAALRAGLSRRQYQSARARLAERGLIEVQDAGGGSLASLVFAETGPSIEREINPRCFEAVLSTSATRGGARALLAVLAALSDGEGVVAGLGIEGLCDASGLSDRTYRRARSELLQTGAVVLEHAGGGRGCCNVWRLATDAPSSVAADRRPARRPAPASRQLPLVAVVRDQPGRVSEPPAPASTPPESGPSSKPGEVPGRNPGVNPGQNRTPHRSETPAKTLAQTPAPHARAGMESQNQRTRPPNPPEGGPVTTSITESFITRRGRSRLRRVEVDPAAELTGISDEQQRTWPVVQKRLRELAGDSLYDIWLAGLQPIAVSRHDDALLLAARPDLQRWIACRHRRLFEVVSLDVGCSVRMASDRELTLHQAFSESPAPGSPDLARVPDRQEAI